MESPFNGRREQAEYDADVLVVGAGPTGLTLATALVQRGIRTLVVDRLAVGENTSRAAVVHARTLEVLESIGVTASLVAQGIPTKQFTIRDRDHALLPLSFDNLPSQYPYALMVSQATTEQVLLQKLEASGGTIIRPHAFVSLEQDANGVTVLLDDGDRRSAKFVVGADGMHSKVRECIDIPFVGAGYAESFVLADAKLTGGVPAGEVTLFFSPAGMVVVAPLPGGSHRVVATTDVAPKQPDATWLQELLDARGPTKVKIKVGEVLWGSRFHVHHKVADRYRAGRVLLAGDAAHVHSPAGGLGMNAGILDAIALSGALEQALQGDLDALDRYGASRRPAAQKIVALADRLTRLATISTRFRPLRNLIMSFLGRMPLLRRKLAWQLSGLVYR